MELQGASWLYQEAVAGSSTTADLRMRLQLSCWTLALQHRQRPNFPALAISRLGRVVIQFCAAVPQQGSLHDVAWNGMRSGTQEECWTASCSIVLPRLEQSVELLDTTGVALPRTSWQA